MVNLSIVCYDDKGEVSFEKDYSGFNRNGMFLEELRLFYAIRQGEAEAVLTIEEGMLSLEVALAAKRSMDEGIVVRI